MSLAGITKYVTPRLAEFTNLVAKVPVFGDLGMAGMIHNLLVGNINSKASVSETDFSITSRDNNLISRLGLIAGKSGARSINLASNAVSTIITSAQDTSSASTETTDQNYNDFKFAYDRGRVSVNSNSKIF
jgi:hypothetical protein